MDKKIMIGGLLIVIVAFYGGVKYSDSKQPTQNTRFQTGINGGMRGGRMMNGSVTTGEIISKDSTGLTVKTRDGSSKIVIMGASTMVQKTVAGSLNDLQIGNQVNIIGSANTDGSITAESVQLRPSTTTPNR